MRKGLTKLLAVALSATVLVGCGGGGGGGTATPSNSNNSSAPTETETQASGLDKLGAFTSIAKEGVVDMSYAGMKVTLPDELKDSGYNIAGFAIVDYNQMTGRLWLYDPNEDMMTQPTEPSFVEFLGVPADQTFDEYVASIAPKDTPQEMLDMYKQCHIVLGSNQSYTHYIKDRGKFLELLPELVSTDEEVAQSNRDPEIDQTRIDQSNELRKQYFDQAKNWIEIVDLELPKAQKASDVDTTKLASLTLQDLAGNQTKLADVFAKNKLTMIDIWKTDCTVCVQEMPGLEELSKKYADQGFGVLSVCVDVLDNNGTIDEDLMYDAQDIVKTAGTTYPVVLADKDFRGLIDVTSTPTILWVDSQGNIVAGPERGSSGKDKTAEQIESLLQGLQ